MSCGVPGCVVNHVLQNALLKLSLEDDDVVFVDRNVIDTLALAQTDLGRDAPRTTFFAVDVKPGCTLKDLIRQVDLARLKRTIAEIEKEPK
jgi:hypothetical protein